MWDISIKNVLLFAVAASRGGYTRARILKILKKDPQNAHQLSKVLGMDYKTIQHHLKVLEDNKLVSIIKKGSYGALYMLCDELEKTWDDYGKIWEKVGK